MARRRNAYLPASTLIIMIIGLLVGQCVVYSSPQYLPVHNVNTNKYFSSIQEAINDDSTTNGHTILVSAGVYYENIVINKSISLISASKHLAVIDGGGRGTVIRIEAKNCTLEGFTVKKSGAGFSGVMVLSSQNKITNNLLIDNYNGIYLKSCRNNVVSLNDIKKGEHGIRLYNSSQNFILNNLIEGFSNGISLEVSFSNRILNNTLIKNSGNGFFVYNSDKNEFKNNNVSSNLGRGVRLLNSNQNVIERNFFYNNTYAVDLHFSYKNKLAYNTIIHGSRGIWLYNSSANVINLNNISSNRGAGIYILSSQNCTINGNSISGNEYGVLLDRSNNNTVSSNSIEDNVKFGISLENSSFNMIYHNNFINNGVNVKQPSDGSLANLWDDGFEGNFWSDYYGSDRDLDGIGDVPYLVDDRKWLGYHSRDNYPLMGKIQEFSVNFKNKSYLLRVISNLTILSLKYWPSKENETSAIKLQLTRSTGFIRITVPHQLVNPPFNATANNITLTPRMILTRQNCTWLYLKLTQAKREVTIRHIPEGRPPPLPPPPPPPWRTWWMWTITALIIAFSIQFFISLRLRSTVGKLRRLLEEYSPFRIAQQLFSEDVKRRKSKIRDFESKYGIKVRPKESLNEILKKLRERRENER